MIIPQREFALPVVHDVRPDKSGPGGLFLKFIVPRPEGDCSGYLERLGFIPWRPGIDWHDPPEQHEFGPGAVPLN